MDSTNSSHSWLGAFAARLMQLRPATNAGSAVRCAVASIHYAFELDPCSAAELFALANPIRERAEKRRRSRPSESHVTRYRELFGFRPSARMDSAGSR